MSKRFLQLANRTRGSGPAAAWREHATRYAAKSVARGRTAQLGSIRSVRKSFPTFIFVPLGAEIRPVWICGDYQPKLLFATPALNFFFSVESLINVGEAFRTRPACQSSTVR